MNRACWGFVALTACGGPSYCERSAEWFSCGAEVEVSDEELAACEEALEPCSSDDQRSLIEATECLLDLGLFGFCDSTDTDPGTITTGEAEDLAAEAAECEAAYNAVSAACLEALYVDSTTTVSSD